MRARPALAIGLAFALTPLTPLAHWATEARAAGCAAQKVSGKWTTSAFPLPTTPNAKLVRDPRDAKRLFATDGTAVMRSTDDGCTWASVFAASAPDTSGLPGGNGLPTQIAYYVSSIVPSGGPAVYLTLAPGSHAQVVGTFAPSAPPVLIAASIDGGATFTVQPPQAGAAAANQPRCNTSSLAVAPSSPSTLYLACAGAVFLDSFIPVPVVGQPASPEPLSNSQEVFYVSTDSGLTWSRQLQTGIPQPSVGVTELFVDPLNAKTLWARTVMNAGTQALVIVKSTDGARTWHLSYRGPDVPGIPTQLGFTAVHKKGKPVRLLGWGPNGAVTSVNGGTTWVPLATGTGPGVYQGSFDGTGDRFAVTFSAGAPCTAKAQLFMFDTKTLRKPAPAALVTNPASSIADIPLLAANNAGAKTFTGLARVYQPSGSPSNTAACVVPNSPVPPPAPPRPTGEAWTDAIVTYRG
jgi:hypothetical protein